MLSTHHFLQKQYSLLLVLVIACSVLHPIDLYADSKKENLIKTLKRAPSGSLTYTKIKSIVKTLAKMEASKAFRYTKIGIRGFFRGEENRYQAIRLCRQTIKIVKKSNVSPALKNKNIKQLSFEIMALQPGFIY